FQAEDGIRDFHVTGVQTCALPIYPCYPMMQPFGHHPHMMAQYPGMQNPAQMPFMQQGMPGMQMPAGNWDLDDWDNDYDDESPNRSEERRVGKECRSRW